MGQTPGARARRRALFWTGAYSAAVVVATSLLPLWVSPCPPDAYRMMGGYFLCFWEAVGPAIRESDPAYLWSGLNRSPTLVLAALAVLTWPLTFTLAMWCRRPDGAADYEDTPHRPRPDGLPPRSGPAILGG
jgi:hypothetical protein